MAEKETLEGASAPVVEAIRDVVAESRDRFEDVTAEHTMIIRRDDGLYRHLKFGKPGTSIYSFDLLTWPGYLAIVGDCGDFVFMRIADMFEFFEGESINPNYWSGKLQAPRPSAALKFSEDVFKRRVNEWLTEICSDLDDAGAASLRVAVDEQIFSELFPTGQDAHRLLQEFDHNGTRIYDSWEWDLREYDFHFLFCCWAIVWGIAKYREAASTTAADAAS